MFIEGIIKEIIYRNQENAFTVAILDTPEDEITITGTLFQANVGDMVRINGEFTYHPKFGEQIKIESAESILPSSAYMIQKFLSSGVIPFVGKRMAEVLVKAFGEETLAIMESQPEKLLKIPGIGKKKCQAIQAAMAEQKESREIILFLQALGISPTFGQRIYQHYGLDTIQKVKENPYQLIDTIRGIGFHTADQIALRNQLDPKSPLRIEAGILYTLTMEANLNGHCYVPQKILLEQVSVLLKLNMDLVTAELQYMMIKDKIIMDTIQGEEVVYYAPLYDCEVVCANKLVRMMMADTPILNWEIDEEMSLLTGFEGFVLADNQYKAIKAAIENRLMIITGGPGTGKTTIIRIIAEIFHQNDKSFLLCAPTGRAAKRMEISTGYPAMTIHRMLGYRPTGEEGIINYEYDEENPIQTDLIIVDEASMIDITLFENLLKAINLSTRLIFVGDVDQLPSVGPGNVLKDLIDSERIVTIQLDEVFRQKKESNIVINAHRINRGEEPILNQPDKDFFMISAYGGTQIRNQLIQLAKFRLPNYYQFDSIQDIQILTPMKKGETGTIALNRAFQDELNPPGPHKIEVIHGDRIFREKDKIMQIKNNYSTPYRLKFSGEEGIGVYNGEFGIIEEIDEEERLVKIMFDNEKLVVYKIEELDEISLAYAITIHKSQGSEFPAVIIPLSPGPPMLMTRNLIYTAVTRAKKLVVLVGESRFLSQMIENNRIHQRYSSLAFRVKKNIQLFEEVVQVEY